MKKIVNYIRLFFKEINKVWLICCVLLMILLVTANYAFGLEDRLIAAFPQSAVVGYASLYALAWLPSFLLYRLIVRDQQAISLKAWLCILAAPLLFAVKVGMDTTVSFSMDAAWWSYWNRILYWPLRLITLFGILLLIWIAIGRSADRWGLHTEGFKVRPYAIMLLIMVPLLLLASTQPDFQATYPKLKQVLPLPEGASPQWLYKLLFELSYGTDFISIELFFRGFLVIGMARWLGRDAILPMACFYCSIHFGKPLGECISSFFGGLILGVVSYHTRSIYGGLMVHLGIAWLMELCGYLAHLYKW
ncbi:MAG: CPBP family intramembrane metalloprotease [Sphingobacteriales bacterium]|nr:CPBP family intramembrane metalloprotease [Sphingobacteriales bacterium]NCT72965.1 CPBP family intramembrane metalloprotease [Chitinophagaceae bacterium]OJW30262.1 MAG: hypothetical protein BGO54_01330 [Sphingobacteriales bacterium 46-32]